METQLRSPAPPCVPAVVNENTFVVHKIYITCLFKKWFANARSGTCVLFMKCFPLFCLLYCIKLVC